MGRDLISCFKVPNVSRIITISSTEIPIDHFCSIMFHPKVCLLVPHTAVCIWSLPHLTCATAATACFQQSAGFLIHPPKGGKAIPWCGRTSIFPIPILHHKNVSLVQQWLRAARATWGYLLPVVVLPIAQKEGGSQSQVPDSTRRSSAILRHLWSSRKMVQCIRIQAVTVFEWPWAMGWYNSSN